MLLVAGRMMFCGSVVAEFRSAQPLIDKRMMRTPGRTERSTCASCPLRKLRAGGNANDVRHERGHVSA